MKEKILAAIKAKFPGVNLSKKRLDAIAANIEKKVLDDETKIDASLDALDDAYPLSEIAKDDNLRSTLEGKLKATQTAPKNDPPVDDPLNDPDVPAWAKAITEQNKALTENLATLLGEKRNASIKTKIGEKLKEVPEVFWAKRALPTKDEDLDAFIEDAQTDYATFAQAQTDKGLGAIPIPGGGKTPEKTAVVSPEIKAFAEKQAAAQKTA